MIEEKEKEAIIEEAVNKAVEKTLLMIPEVIGNLIASHAALHKINAKFYADHPEFKDHKDVVAAVVEMVEGKDPNAKYEDILDRAVPEIRHRITMMKNLDLENVSRTPDRNFQYLQLPESPKDSYGEI